MKDAIDGNVPVPNLRTLRSDENEQTASVSTVDAAGATPCGTRAFWLHRRICPLEMEKTKHPRTENPRPIDGARVDLKGSTHASSSCVEPRIMSGISRRFFQRASSKNERPFSPQRGLLGGSVLPPGRLFISVFLDVDRNGWQQRVGTDAGGPSTLSWHSSVHV